MYTYIYKCVYVYIYIYKNVYIYIYMTLYDCTITIILVINVHCYPKDGSHHNPMFWSDPKNYLGYPYRGKEIIST